MKETRVSAEPGNYASYAAKELNSEEIDGEGMEIKWREEDHRLEDWQDTKPYEQRLQDWIQKSSTLAIELTPAEFYFKRDPQGENKHPNSVKALKRIRGLGEKLVQHVYALQHIAETIIISNQN
ncbi:MAG: hypothetical protein Q9221_003601 [Calogaya cf. arnoldii]